MTSTSHTKLWPWVGIMINRLFIGLSLLFTKDHRLTDVHLLLYSLYCFQCQCYPKCIAIANLKMFLITSLLLSLLASVGATTPIIYFGFVASDDTTSAELTPSLDIALSTINNSSSVLPGYQLSYVPWISEVRSSAKVFTDFVVSID